MIKITPDLAEICGIHAGDGYLRIRKGNKGEVDISGNLEEKEYYDFHVVPLFNKVFGLSMQARTFSRGTYGFVTYQKRVRELLMNLGFPSGKKSLIVEAPKLILESNDLNLYAKFLRGLLDTDGHIGFRKCYGKYNNFKKKYHHYPTICLTTISGKLAKDISFMLNKLGIEHFVYSSQSKNLRDRCKYRIIINGVNRMNLWMKIIGSKNPVKYSRYLIWKKLGFCTTNTSLEQRKELLKTKINSIV